MAWYIDFAIQRMQQHAGGSLEETLLHEELEVLATAYIKMDPQTQTPEQLEIAIALSFLHNLTQRLTPDTTTKINDYREIFIPAFIIACKLIDDAAIWNLNFCEKNDRLNNICLQIALKQHQLSTPDKVSNATFTKDLRQQILAYAIRGLDKLYRLSRKRYSTREERQKQSELRRIQATILSLSSHKIKSEHSNIIDLLQIGRMESAHLKALGFEAETDLAQLNLADIEPSILFKALEHVTQALVEIPLPIEREELLEFQIALSKQLPSVGMNTVEKLLSPIERMIRRTIPTDKRFTLILQPLKSDALFFSSAPITRRKQQLTLTRERKEIEAKLRVAAKPLLEFIQACTERTASLLAHELLSPLAEFAFKLISISNNATEYQKQVMTDAGINSILNTLATCITSLAPETDSAACAEDTSATPPSISATIG